MKERFSNPSEWKDIDQEVSDKFDALVEAEQPDGADTELNLLKDCIYTGFMSKFGPKAQFKHSKTKKHVDQEKKILRKQKNTAKKEYKRLRREAADEETLKNQHHAWRKLTRYHNKVRLQEIELENKLTEVRNNTAFAKDPFNFIKHEVTTGAKRNLEPSCSLEEAWFE